MSVIAGVAQLLWADATMRALLPGGISRILKPEGGALPSMTYQVVGGSSSPTFALHGQQRRRVQFDIYAAAAEDADLVRDQLFNLLDGASGTLPNGAYLVDAAFIQDLDFFDSAPRSFRIAAEYYITFDL